MGYNATISFQPAGIDACALWRMWMPHLSLPHSRFLFSEGRPYIEEMSECDTIVVQRLMQPGNAQFLKIAKTYGLNIVYDLDDNIWDLPASNPAAQFFHSKKSQEGIVECTSWADVITVSTDDLKKVVENKLGHLRNRATGLNIPVIKIDNCVDMNLFHKPVIARDADKIVIGWGGSNTHSGDIRFVWELLPFILDRYPNVYMEFAGMGAPEKIRNHPRVKQLSWCHVSEYHNRYATWNWDIVLAPLEMHRFNRSKSSIKMIEAGCIAKPCLAQDISPYRYFCSFTPQLKWLLCSDYDWEKKLHRLIQDKPFREDLGACMYQNVVDNFQIQRTIPQWQAIAQGLSE